MVSHHPEDERRAFCGWCRTFPEQRPIPCVRMRPWPFVSWPDEAAFRRHLDETLARLGGVPGGV
jgi:hypothetical protein